MTYLIVFASALLAATILPFSSELTVIAAIQTPDISLVLIWIMASVGNILGSVCNYVLGAFCLRWQQKRWFPVSVAVLQRAQDRFQRWGKWSLLLAWVPLVGDPLTMVAGVMRLPWHWFLPLVAIGKAGRYAVLIALVS